MKLVIFVLLISLTTSCVHARMSAKAKKSEHRTGVRVLLTTKKIR